MALQTQWQGLEQANSTNLKNCIRSVGHYGLIYNPKGIEYNFVTRFTNWKTYRGVTENNFETLKGPENYERTMLTLLTVVTLMAGPCRH